MDLFKLNDKIELIAKDEDKTMCFIYDLKDENILVSISADDENFKLLEVGEDIRASIYSKNEVIGFEAKIADRLFTNSSLYELKDIRNFIRIQRRENIRVRLTKEILYTDNEFLQKINFYGKKTEELVETIERYLKEGFMLDLSAGGLKLSSKESLELGAVLILVINFEDEDMILKGKIVHKDLNLVPNKTVYLYGIKFIDIKEGEQEKIIRHLFVMMRKNRIK